ncbi:MAG TPA: hypothetical protein VMO20_07450, partial [Candidatus Acidoferrum sp.]|nr:hypothetical protein [Candidatus Acidoferrum sp.]
YNSEAKMIKLFKRAFIKKDFRVQIFRMFPPRHARVLALSGVQYQAANSVHIFKFVCDDKTWM